MNEAFSSFPFAKLNDGKLKELDKIISEEDQKESNDTRRSQQELLLSLLSMPEHSKINPETEEQIVLSTEPQLSASLSDTQEDTKDDLTSDAVVEQINEEAVSQPKTHPLKANTEKPDITSLWEINSPSSPTVMIATPIDMLNIHSAYGSTSQIGSSINNMLPIKPPTTQSPSLTNNGPKPIWFLSAIVSMIIFTAILSAAYLVNKDTTQLDTSQSNAHNSYTITLSPINSKKAATVPAAKPTTNSITQTTLIPNPPLIAPQPNSSQSAVPTQPLSPVPSITLASSQTATPMPQPSISYEAEATDNTEDGTKIFSCNLCSGGLRVGWINYNIFLQFNNVYVNQNGNYTLKIYYLNSIANRVTSAFANVNGGPNVTVPGLKVLTSNCCDNVPPQVTEMTISLHAGNNTIKISNPKGYAPDIDRIVIG